MSDGQATVSIVTVTLNDRLGLQRTEESIARQTSRDYEWIVVDGGSRDGSVEVLRSSRIEPLKWTSEPDDGIYDAMNKGIARADGRYVLFLNAGDVLAAENVLERVIEVIESLTTKMECPPMIGGGVNLLLEHGLMAYRPARSARYVWHGLPMYHQAALFPSDFLMQNPYDTSYSVSGDYYVVALAYKSGMEFFTVDFPIATFVVGGFSYQHPMRLIQDCVRVQRNVLCLGYPTILMSVVYRLLKMGGLMTMMVGSRVIGSRAKTMVTGR